ncbi:MAG: hypothetical protein EAY75_15515 [Bacteroidetes bacterium]|nr:MAG: hypothetical protein EAY75_15515 [Bacteroidota bacterium]
MGNANRINATVPAGAQSGFFVGVINTTTGTLSDDQFTVTAGATISSVSPMSGAPGTQITITGTGFGAVTGVVVGHAAATINSQTATQIVCTVSAAAYTGPIVLSGGFGTVQSTNRFTIIRANVIEACAGSAFSLHASGGGTYQWQINNGTGWTNLTNGAPSAANGVTTSRMDYSTFSSAQSGDRFRCLVNGTPSTEFTLRAKNVFLGAANGVFDVASQGNNNCNQPFDAYTDLVLPPNNSTPFFLQTPLTIRSLLISPNTRFNVSPNTTLIITARRP